MGMDYYIETKNETEDEFDFPQGLSYFFEQLGGYGDTSMVSQVEKMLDIDLSLFQKTYHHDMEYDEEFEDEFDDEAHNENDESDDFWLNIDDVKAVIREFILKIAELPEYHTRVIYGGMLYPEDTGYLSSGEIVQDLRKLYGTLSTMKVNFCSEIRLVYA